MLAVTQYPARQQHTDQRYSDQPSPATSLHSFVDSIEDGLFCNFSSYFLAAPEPPVINTLATRTGAAQYMSNTPDLQNPAIRIQQSTPLPRLLADLSRQTLISNNTASRDWNTFQESDGQLDAKPVLPPRGQPHQRAPSSSSIGSSSSAVQYNQGHATSYPFVAHSEHHSSSVQEVDSSYAADESSRTFSNHLPTPTHTPTNDSFLLQCQTFAPQLHHLDSPMTAYPATKQTLMDHQGDGEDMPGFTHSSRHSVSSFGHDSPATPHTSHGEDFDDKYKMPSAGENISRAVESWMGEYLHFDDDSDFVRPTVPKLDRTMSDAYQDELYNPSRPSPIIIPAPPKTSSLLSPYRNVVSERLQMAHQARSQSPSQQNPRPVSPFRQGSPYAPPDNTFDSPRARLGTAAQVREQQKAESDALALQQQQIRHRGEDAQPKTVSPKDVTLEYKESEEDSKISLFPEASGDYANQYSGGEQYPNQVSVRYGNSTNQSYAIDTGRSPNWSTTGRQNPTYGTSSNSLPPQSNFNFAPPSIPGSMHEMPFPAQQYRPVTAVTSAPELTPEFPAHVTSMESSASEAGPEPSSQPSSGEVKKPANVHADTGTYSCTYHGCTLRFDTPQKLQKHKREGHRQNPQPGVTPGVGSGMTAAALQARNNQAGPHKCERINPTTGRPCNTIFSRPYDLTRHEDTIHNARKQKVRCALCVEEKTFSRNDALTRHMRVVHPDVDFPGKHRRRGGHD